MKLRPAFFFLACSSSSSSYLVLLPVRTVWFVFTQFIASCVWVCTLYTHFILLSLCPVHHHSLFGEDTKFSLLSYARLLNSIKNGLAKLYDIQFADRKPWNPMRRIRKKKPMHTKGKPLARLCLSWHRNERFLSNNQKKKNTTTRRTKKKINTLIYYLEQQNWANKSEERRTSDINTEITIAWVYLSSIQFWLLSLGFAIQSEKFRAFVFCSVANIHFEKVP